MCQLKSRKHSAKSPKANCIWPKEIHEKVSALNITTPLLEREPSRWTPRVRTRRFYPRCAMRGNPVARHKENP